MKITPTCNIVMLYYIIRDRFLMLICADNFPQICNLTAKREMFSEAAEERQ